MKLQYRCIEYMGFQYLIKLYHDGCLVKSYKTYLDRVNDEIERLEKKGYSRGYTQEEVDKAKERYEKRLQNVIHEVCA